MASVSITHSLTNGQIADANHVNTNFLDVKNFVEAALVQVDGSVQAGTTALANLAVTEAKIADSSITSAKIVDGTIVNADINASAAIVDTKLATIATALKVSNSATTATSANTASAIVARDGSGNFTAGTITASLTGNVTGNVTGSVTGTASGNLVSGGALGTPSSGNLGNCTFPTLNQSTSGNAATATNLTTMGKGSNVTTLYNSNGSFTFAHGLSFTPSTVIAVNGDHSAHDQALTLTPADGTNIYGRFLSTTTNPSVRVNWVAFA